MTTTERTAPTSGSWAVCDDGVSVYQPEQDTLISTYGGDASLWGLNDDEMRANARLISAAPSLLAAAIRAVDALEWAESELDGEAPTSDAVRQLRAAIEKATGETK